MTDAQLIAELETFRASAADLITLIDPLVSALKARKIITDLRAILNVTTKKVELAYTPTGERNAIEESKDGGQTWRDTGISDTGGSEPVPYTGRARYRMRTPAGRYSNETGDVEIIQAPEPTPVDQQFTRIVQAGKDVGSVVNGKVGIEDGAVAANTIVVSSGALLGAVTPHARLVSSDGGSEPEIVKMAGNAKVVGILFDHVHGATVEAYAIRPTGSGNVIQGCSWTDRLTRFITGSQVFGSLLVLDCGSDAVLGGARQEAHNVYGAYLTSGSGPWEFINFKVRAFSNFCFRAMMCHGPCLIDRFDFAVSQSNGRSFALRGTLPTGSLTGRNGVVHGGQFELGGDTLTNGVEQPVVRAVLSNITFDGMDQIQWNGAPGQRADWSDITVKNHRRTSVLDMKRGVASRANPAGSITRVSVTGSTSSRLFSERFSTVAASGIVGVAQ